MRAQQQTGSAEVRRERCNHQPDERNFITFSPKGPHNLLLSERPPPVLSCAIKEAVKEAGQSQRPTGRDQLLSWCE